MTTWGGAPPLHRSNEPRWQCRRLHRSKRAALIEHACAGRTLRIHCWWRWSAMSVTGCIAGGTRVAPTMR